MIEDSAGGPPAPRQEPRWHWRHYLPHLENKPLQFITYRLFDSVPKAVVNRWKAELAISEDSAPNAPECQELRRRVERYADAGFGACFLKDPRVASLVQENLLRFDGDRYGLVDWCIMPNHVHVLVEVAEGWTLSQILHGWRSYTAHEANKLLGRSGEFWQSEYFDRFIRNAEHLRKTVEYIDENPRKAGLEGWPWRGAACRGAGGPPAESPNIAGGPPAPRQGNAGGPPAPRQISHRNDLNTGGLP